MAPRWATFMQDREIVKAFGARLKALRKHKQWTQKELAAKLGVQAPQLNKYECGLNAPPVEKLVELAELLGTTVDFLLTGDRTEARPLHNVRLLERFRALEDLAADDQEVAIKLIDALIVKHRAESALRPLDKQAS